jgi:hypothetical protein
MCNNIIAISENQPFPAPDSRVLFLLSAAESGKLCGNGTAADTARKRQGVRTIVEPSNNVILFPTTVAHYERELTKLLESERYSEAVRLLLFLAGCQGAPPDKSGEWKALLSWLQTMFPETAFEPDSRYDSSGLADTDEDDREEQFVQRYVTGRSGADASYGLQLIELLRASSSPERQLMALEQLAFAQQPELDPLLLQWLSETETHPMVQFKALQTLKKRGCKGTAVFPKLGVDISVEIEETPADFDEFPERVQDIIGRVEQISEASQPDFPYFARQTWLEFLAYVYGTEAYRDIAAAGRDGAVDAWAAALHRMLLETMFGEADVEELADLYGITAALQPLWNEAYAELKRFGRLLMPSAPWA